MSFPHMARLRRADVPCECPLIGVNRKWLADRQNDANDPFRTLGRSVRADSFPFLPRRPVAKC
jgi:hypothetical protein